MVTSRAQLLKELVPGLHALFGLDYDRYDDEHTMVYDVESSSRAFEEEVKLSGLGLAPSKTEGQANEYGSMQESWVARYNHSTICYGFVTTEEAMEDNLYESLAKRGTSALALSMHQTKQVLSMVPLNLGHTSYTVGDGQNLFSTAHPTTIGLTNSNTQSTPADFSETSLEAAIIQMAAWVDEQGLLIQARPRKLIIPPSLEFTAERILKSELQPNSMDNNVNAVKNRGRVPEGFHINHYLTDTNAWFLKTDVPNGMKHFVRVALKTKADGDFDTGNMKFRARERYSFGCSDPLGMWGSPGGS
jgi:hypothetical protein